MWQMPALDAPGATAGARDVAAEHGGGEAVLGVVGDAIASSSPVHADDRLHRAEAIPRA